MSEISFNSCPICGEELTAGKIKVPISRNPGIFNHFTDVISFYPTDLTDKKHSVGNCTKETCFSAYDQPCIPAGYCESCDRIFAELDIRMSYNPIGEDTLPAKDICDYSHEYQEIKEENNYIQEDDPYAEWKGIIDFDLPDHEK
ncbi:MAG: hypothetical protein IKQ90_08750 [Ruminococcus sp.]|nr:hypothetical protein [Ruminococcus sp.]